MKLQLLFSTLAVVLLSAQAIPVPTVTNSPSEITNGVEDSFKPVTKPNSSDIIEGIPILKSKTLVQNGATPVQARHNGQQHDSQKHQDKNTGKNDNSEHPQPQLGLASNGRKNVRMSISRMMRMNPNYPTIESR